MSQIEFRGLGVACIPVAGPEGDVHGLHPARLNEMFMACTLQCNCMGCSHDKAMPARLACESQRVQGAVIGWQTCCMWESAVGVG